MTNASLKYVLCFEKHSKRSSISLSEHIMLPSGETPASATAMFEFSEEPDATLVKRLCGAMGEDWLKVQSGWTAATPLAMTPIQPDEAKSLLLKAKSALEQAGVKGADWATEAPTGWSRIIYVFAGLLCDLIAHAPNGSQVRVDCIKEKFGTLRIYTGQTGLPEDLASELSNLEIWAETQSYGRCMATGRLGTNAMSEHYICTLSEEARKAREDDLERFNRDCWPLASADTHP